MLNTGRRCSTYPTFTHLPIHFFSTDLEQADPEQVDPEQADPVAIE